MTNGCGRRPPRVSSTPVAAMLAEQLDSLRPLLLFHRLAAVHHLAVHRHRLTVFHHHRLPVLHHHRPVGLYFGAVGHGHLLIHRPRRFPALHHHHLAVLHHHAIHVSGDRPGGESADDQERDSNYGD